MNEALHQLLCTVPYRTSRDGTSISGFQISLVFLCTATIGRGNHGLFENSREQIFLCVLPLTEPRMA